MSPRRPAPAALFGPLWDVRLARRCQCPRRGCSLTSLVKHFGEDSSARQQVAYIALLKQDCLLIAASSSTQVDGELPGMTDSVLSGARDAQAGRGEQQLQLPAAWTLAGQRLPHQPRSFWLASGQERLHVRDTSGLVISILRRANVTSKLISAYSCIPLLR